jgi:hypothetical protein
MEFDCYNAGTMIKIRIMVKREELKRKALACVNEIINQRGGRSIAVHIKRKGKRTWTWNEYKEAIVNDSNLYDGDKEVMGTNPIDEFHKQFVFNFGDTLPNGIKLKRRQN